MSDRVPRHLRDIVKVALAAGWTYDVTRGGHPRLTPPDKSLSPVISGGTPSDHRALRNLKSDLRRRGLDI